MENISAKNVTPISGNLFTAETNKNQANPLTGGKNLAENFFCEGCLRDKSQGEQSPDSRYCLSCYDFLLQEAALTRTAAAWVPVKFEAVTSGAGEESNGGDAVTADIRAKVRALNGQGLSTRAIAQAVGHEISHMTVARWLKQQHI